MNFYHFIECIFCVVLSVLCNFSFSPGACNVSSPTLRCPYCYNESSPFCNVHACIRNSVSPTTAPTNSLVAVDRPGLFASSLFLIKSALLLLAICAHAFHFLASASVPLYAIIILCLVGVICALILAFIVFSFCVRRRLSRAVSEVYLCIYKHLKFAVWRVTRGRAVKVD